MEPVTHFQKCISFFLFSEFFSWIFSSLTNTIQPKRKNNFQPERQKAAGMNPLLETENRALLWEVLHHLFEVYCNTAVNTEGLVLTLETAYA